MGGRPNMTIAVNRTLINQTNKQKMSIVACVLTLEMNYCRSVPDVMSTVPPKMETIPTHFIADDFDSLNGLNTPPAPPRSTAPPPPPSHPIS